MSGVEVNAGPALSIVNDTGCDAKLAKVGE